MAVPTSGRSSPEAVLWIWRWVSPCAALQTRGLRGWTLLVAEADHPGVTGTLQVAARVTGLCLDRSGHLPDNDYLTMAARGGLLVDLALAERLAQTDDSIELDVTPTGWPPADHALTEFGLLDGRSLDWWLEHSRLRLDDIATALVADGAWTRLPARALNRQPRYAVREVQALARDRVLLAEPHRIGDAAGAAVVAIAVAAGLAKEQPSTPAAVEFQLGAESVTWVCRLVTEFIRSARSEGAAVSRASQNALWSGMPY